eukprot:m.28941 g.28941  ORF g.28941 m.28941 type:complete len:631 (+) comp6105_c0_seq1:24-1916(+)
MILVVLIILVFGLGKGMWRRVSKRARKSDIFVMVAFLFLILHLATLSSKKLATTEAPPWKPKEKSGGMFISDGTGGVSSINVQEELSLANKLLEQVDALNPKTKLEGKSTIDKELHLSTKVQSAEEKKEEEKEGWDRNNFNQYLSDRISLHRDIHDTRHELCKSETFDVSSFPDTTVIIPFHNEARTTLLRTVWSVLDRSPPSLINEILLIDDASTMEHLKTALQDEVETIPKTRIVRLQERSGLIRAKVIGAEQAKGKVVTFLDSHCECNVGWLEPLLARIAFDRTIVVTPVIDNIDKNTFHYSGGPNVITRGVFTWSLTFSWLDLPWYEQEKRKNPIAPLRSPTMAGGLFSMDREYFFELGSYDLGMDVWGGENLEISFRIWQCGGSMEFVPCSRVGHVYRDHHPYTFPSGIGETINRNLNRVAEVWMDDYKEFYYELRPQHRRIGTGDISERLALRKKLNCKPFKWFLDNVYPDKFAPIKENVIGYGPIKNPVTNHCLDSMSNLEKTMKAGLYQCITTYSENQIYYFTKTNNEIRREGQFNAMCLDFSGKLGGNPSMYGCHFMKGNQEWERKNSKIIHVPTGFCLTASVSSSKAELVMNICQEGNAHQEWVFDGPKSEGVQTAFYSA